MRWIPLAALLAGCAMPPANHDDAGTITGEVHRYVVDAIELPARGTEAREIGDDLDGDGAVDNQLGVLTAALVTVGDENTHGADLIAAGVLASSVEIQADDLSHDPTVAVSYFASDDAAPTPVLGTLAGGVFRSERTATTRTPGWATVRLPVFADADPSEVELDGLEMELVPDGRGGYDATVRGGIPAAMARAVADLGLQEMIARDPQGHPDLVVELDTNHDGSVSDDELAHATLLDSLLAPDIQLYEGDAYAPDPSKAHPDSLSAGFSVHLSPFAAGGAL